MTVNHIGYCDWLCKPEWLELDEDVEIVNDLTCGWQRKENCFNVFIDYNEPDCFLCTELNHVLERVNDFDLIVTRRPELLEYPNAKKLLCGGSWLSEEYRNNPNTNKDPSVSFTSTIKCLLFYRGIIDGYDMRHDIMRNWNEVVSYCSLPIYFYNSLKFPVPTVNPVEQKFLHETNKNECMDHMFHIAVENSSLPNYITEKIIDCFASKSIPIYYGCENIGEYFDSDGILQFRTQDELMQILNNISPELYEEKREVIDKNYELSKKWWDTNTIFWNYVVEGISKKMIGLL